MKSSLCAVLLSIAVAAAPLAFAQQAPVTKIAGGTAPVVTQESPRAAVAGAAGELGAAAIVGIAAAIAVVVAVSSSNDNPDLLPPTSPTGTATGTK